jgi:hypothetical protein
MEEVVNAVEAGKLAAQGIHEVLTSMKGRVASTLPRP